MSYVVLTPYERGAAVELASRLWWKRILPVGDVEYKGRKLQFNQEYLASLAEAFEDGAYDQVPFQMADAQNTHTNDPERFRGDIKAMEARPDGLWIGLKPTARGEKTLLENPLLGVSARIVEHYDRSDGKYFPAAIQHVLGTLDPRIPGLGGWQAIEAANEAEITIDLTGMSFAGEGRETGSMPDLNAEQQARLARLLEIPDDKFSQLMAGLQAPAPVLVTGTGTEDEMTDEALADLLGVPVDKLDDVLAAGLAEPAPAGAGSSLTNEDVLMALELSTGRADQNAIELAQVRGYLNNEQYLRERRELADLGIPPRITDLARPLLEGSGHVFEMSSGSGQPTVVDGGQVMRQVLREYAQTAQLMDLSPELGTPMDEPEGTAHAAEVRDEIVQRAKHQLGLGR
jgi:hypothetical protein